MLCVFVLIILTKVYALGYDQGIDKQDYKLIICKYRSTFFMRKIQSGKITLSMRDYKEVCEIRTSEEKSNDRIDQIVDQGLHNGRKYRTNDDTNSHIHHIAFGNEISEFV